MELIVDEMEEMDDTLDAEYRVLAECFSALPEPHRQLIQQRYAQKWFAAQIAARSGWPVQRVYKMLDRIRKVLLGCVTGKLAGGERG